MTVSAIKEIKCSTKQNLGVFIRSGRQALLASQDTESVIFSGLGAAIPNCIAAASRLEADKVGKIVKVETCMVELQGDKGENRNVAQIRVLVNVLADAKK